MTLNKFTKINLKNQHLKNLYIRYKSTFKIAFTKTKHFNFRIIVATGN